MESPQNRDMRPLALALALALVGCGADVVDASDFGVPGFGGHGSSPSSSDDGDVPADDAGAGGEGGSGGFGGGVEEDAGGLEDVELGADAAPDAKPVEDAGPDVVDAAPDVIDEDVVVPPDAGPVGPPYENENVRCQVVDGSATKTYTCAAMYGPRWEMLYSGVDGTQYRCDGSADDSLAYRAPCKDSGSCRVFRKDDVLYGTCIK